MVHFYESVLIDTIDGFQFKSYANEHPPGHIIVKPKYVPHEALTGKGLKYRFILSRCMVRFNLFAPKETVKDYVAQFRTKFPDYIYESPDHQNWFFAVPMEKIKEVHDPKKGLQELLAVPEKDLDEYLTLVVELVCFLTKSGVPSDKLGITHSTLLGNYTYGISDIDIIIYGKKNGWAISHYLEHASHPLLRWKSEAEWREYYKTHKTSESSHFTEDEYVRHLARKKYEGMFGNSVFTLFTVEEPDEAWCRWGEETYEPLGVATVRGHVTNASNSIVRPGCYTITDSRIINGRPDVPVTHIVSYSIPFVQQAKEGEMLEACGLLEKVTIKKRKKTYYRIVVGYFDAYLSDRREQEYIKSLELK